jgi:hypothetical protein
MQSVGEEFGKTWLEKYGDKNPNIQMKEMISGAGEDLPEDTKWKRANSILS